MADCLIQCSLAIVGLCLVVLMFQLYTFLHCNLIRLASAENNPRQLGFALDENAQKETATATKRFSILKYALHTLIFIAFFGTATQLVFIYLRSEFYNQNPMQVSLLSFVTSQESLNRYSPLNLNTVYLI